MGLLSHVELGNLDAKRDWGHAKDYVQAMWLMLQQNKADDYVVATGETYYVREFVTLAFKRAGFILEWSGKGIDEVGKDKDTGKVLVKINPEFYRPAEVELLLGDPKKAENELKWTRSISFEEIVNRMVDNDIAITKKLL